MSSLHPTTTAVRAGIGSDPQHRAVVPPLHLTSTFAFAALGEPGRYDYSRTANPTRDLLGDALAELERGAGAVVTASGMAAITLALQCLRQGDLLIAPSDCYGGTHRLFCRLRDRGHLRVRFVDQRDEPALDLAFEAAPAMVWVETPTNPLLRIVDIAALADRSRAAGALLVVDNTFLSPARQRPIPLGADLVVHSTTKYVNGHSDVVGGAVVSATDSLYGEVAAAANALGLTGAPFDSFLTLRGLRTLSVRMRAHEENAQAVVALLLSHPAVTRVHYPGLASHPGHEVAARQQDGFGGMVSFELAGGLDAARVVLGALRCFSLAESLGGVESLVAHPTTMTHAAMDDAARARGGITEALVRLSVGIEAPEDLVADLDRALELALGVTRPPHHSPRVPASRSMRTSSPSTRTG